MGEHKGTMLRSESGVIWIMSNLKTIQTNKQTEKLNSFPGPGPTLKRNSWEYNLNYLEQKQGGHRYEKVTMDTWMEYRGGR